MLFLVMKRFAKPQYSDGLPSSKGGAAVSKTNLTPNTPIGRPNTAVFEDNADAMRNRMQHDRRIPYKNT